ncbi:MAG: hypothetical protein ACYTDY_14290, partial [Planctomycetota bacterium]
MCSPGRALFALLLTVLFVSPSFAEDDGRTAGSGWSEEHTEKLVALAREYMGKKKNRDKDAILTKARELGTVSQAELKTVVKELFKV